MRTPTLDSRPFAGRYGCVQYGRDDVEHAMLNHSVGECASVAQFSQLPSLEYGTLFESRVMEGFVVKDVLYRSYIGFGILLDTLDRWIVGMVLARIIESIADVVLASDDVI